MLNLTLWIFLLILTYSSLWIFYYFFGQIGLFCYKGVVTIISNIIILKNSINILGINTTLLNITFMSTLFTLNLTIEKYGTKKAIKSVILTIIIHVVFLILINFTLKFKPNEFYMSDFHLKFLFENNMYTVSILIKACIFFISEIFNILIYSFLRKKIINHPCISHNISRIIALGITKTMFLFLVNQNFLFFINKNTKNFMNFTESYLLFNLLNFGEIIFDTLIFHFIKKIKSNEI